MLIGIIGSQSEKIITTESQSDGVKNYLSDHIEIKRHLSQRGRKKRGRTALSRDAKRNHGCQCSPEDKDYY